jgi:hypothetical protein
MSKKIALLCLRRNMFLKCVLAEFHISCIYYYVQALKYQQEVESKQSYVQALKYQQQVESKQM